MKNLTKLIRDNKKACIHWFRMTPPNLDNDEGKVPKKVSNIKEWGKWMKTADRQVARNTINESTISTIFLGIDHRFNSYDAPILFETMIFGGPLDMECRRYSTWDEALIGHQEMIERIKHDARTEN